MKEISKISKIYFWVSVSVPAFFVIFIIASLLGGAFLPPGSFFNIEVLYYATFIALVSMMFLPPLLLLLGLYLLYRFKEKEADKKYIKWGFYINFFFTPLSVYLIFGKAFVLG